MNDFVLYVVPTDALTLACFQQSVVVLFDEGVAEYGRVGGIAEDGFQPVVAEMADVRVFMHACA